MTSNRRSLAALALTGFGLLTIAPRARAQALNVRLGLWEVTSTSQSTGAPAVDLSQVPPEYRARAEAAMKAQTGQNAKPTTRRQCVTKANLEKDFFHDTNKDPSCHWTTIAHTSSLGEFTIACTGKQKVSGHMRYEAVTPESMKGTMTMKIAMADEANPMTSNTTLTAKWIGASCGDLK
jgi:Protein of unknown function (DUF3617)